MTALVVCETLLLVLLTVLVAGLLRSHAEILRRLGAERGAPLAAPPARRGDLRAAGVGGVTLEGDATKIDVGAQDTLLAFLSSGCASCAGFFETFARGAPIPAGIRVVLVAKDASRESPSRLRELAAGSHVILSSAAWSDYRVPGSPYFVLVRGGEVAGEGSAAAWPQLASLLRDALADFDDAVGGELRARRADATLEAAGIGPGHPSLYPTDERWPQSS